MEGFSVIVVVSENQVLYSQLNLGGRVYSDFQRIQRERERKKELGIPFFLMGASLFYVFIIIVSAG